MNTKTVVLGIVLAVAGLGIGYVISNQSAAKQHKADNDQITSLSNQVVNAQASLTEVSERNVALTNLLMTTIATNRVEVAQLSGKLAEAAAAAAAAQSSLDATKASLATAQQENTAANARIADLEARNKSLDQHAAELNAAIAELNATIESTRAKLASSESNNTFLQEELKKQLAQKAELERQFNDLDVLRAQVKKLKTDLYISNRIRMSKFDNGDKRGAELLIQRTAPKAAAAPTAPATKTQPAPKPAQPNYNLNVEVGSDGSVKVIPPQNTATNTPPR